MKNLVINKRFETSFKLFQKRKRNIFKEYSVKELIEFHQIIDKIFKTEKGNYSVKMFDKITDYKKITYSELMYFLEAFHEQYSSRKKKDKKLLNYIKSIHNSKINRMSWSFIKKDFKLKQLKLKNPEDRDNFIFEMNNIKKNYISGSDEDFTTIIYICFHLGLKYKTLYNYFYTK